MTREELLHRLDGTVLHGILDDEWLSKNEKQGACALVMMGYLFCKKEVDHHLQAELPKPEGDDLYFMAKLRQKWCVFERGAPGYDHHAFINPRTGKTSFTEEEAQAFLSTLL